MGAIATTVDSTYTRIGVNLSGWSADGPVPVYRVHEDGSRNLVRGMSAVSGGVAFGWDYESPLSAPVTYEAWDGISLVTSPQQLLPVGRGVSMLTVPGLPSFGGVVEVVRKPSPKRVRPQAMLDVIGRATPIVKSGVLKSAAFDLDIRTYTDSDAYLFTAMLEMSSVLLLRIPGTRVTDWCYIATGDVSESPVVNYKPQPGDPPDGVGSRSVWTMSCRVVESPVGGVFGDPTATYQASLDQYPTYAARLAANATYLDALKA